MTVTVLTGDCRDILRTLPSESVHCVVTSPPYWGLRDYGVAGQLGLEPSLACIACRIRQLVDETAHLSEGRAELLIVARTP